MLGWIRNALNSRAGDVAVVEAFPAAGDVLMARHTLGRALGAGANAVVFEARDTSLGRDVAIKVLKPDSLASRGGAPLGLRAEALAALSLTHPHIVRVFHYEPGPPGSSSSWSSCAGAISPRSPRTAPAVA